MMKTFLTLLFSFAVCALDAATIYVRSGGPDGNGSSWANSKRNFINQYGENRPDRNLYYVAGGTYSGFNVYAELDGTNRVYIKKATVADHGDSTGWDNSYAGQAKFTSGFYFQRGMVTFDGVTGGGPTNWFGPYGFKVEVTSWGYVNGAPASSPAFAFSSSAGGCNNVVVKHVEIQGDGGEGNIKLSPANDAFSIGGPSDDWYVGYIYIHDMGRTGFVADFIHSTIEYVLMGAGEVSSEEHSAPFVFSRCQCPPQNVGFLDITVRYCLIVWHRGTGVITGDGDDIKIYGNVFVDTGSPSHIEEINNGYITTWGTGNTTVNGYRIKNAKIYNNSFIALPTSGTPGNYQNSDLTKLQYNFPVSGNEFINNIIYLSYPGMVGVQTVSHNHYVNPIALIGGLSGTPNVIDWSNVPAQSNRSTNTVNPFIGYTHPTLNFGLTAATPAGLTLPEPFKHDWFGNLRGQDGNWDRGAIEFGGVGGGTPTPPPTIDSSTNASAVKLAPFGGYQISAAGATVYGATNLPPGLSVNGANGIISGTPSAAAVVGTYVVGLLATNTSIFAPTNHAHTNLFFVITAAAAQISVSGTNFNWGEIAATTTRDFVLQITNTGDPSTTLTGHITNESSPWVVQGSRLYSLAGGTGTNKTLRFSPTSVSNYVGIVTFTGGASVITNAIQGAAGPMLTVGAAFPATNGLFVAPFVSTNGVLTQGATDTQSQFAQSGRAVFFFDLSSNAAVTIDCLVAVTNCANDSVRANIDAEPVDPGNIWDIQLTTPTPQTRRIGWRGTGTNWCDNAPEFPTNTWNLMAGVHKLVIIGREAHVQISTITINGPASAMAATPNAASNPTPPSNASGVSLTGILAWEGGSNTDGYRVWFGTNPVPNVLVSTQAQGTPNWGFGTLPYSTQFYWRVDPTNSTAITTGSVWNFTTSAPIAATGETSPIKNARNATILILP